MHAIKNNIEREITTFYANLTVMMRMNACLGMREAGKKKMFNMTVSLHMVKKLLIRNFSNLANKAPFSIYNFGFFIGPFIDIVSKCKIHRDGVSGQIMFAVWFSAQAEMKR